MFINPKFAIEQGWVTGIEDEKEQVQPNAIDFTLDELYSIDQHSGRYFTLLQDNSKYMIGGEKQSPYVAPYRARKCMPEFSYDAQLWQLDGNTSYDGLSKMYVKLPKGIAAMTIIRSTLNRNGLFLTSGLYDSGYEGHIGFALHNQMSNPAFLEPGVRVGQVIFVSSDSSDLYEGGYNHEVGTHHAD